jgi:FKBP-type peptidyl-prolyl cis-trans isomerase
MFRFRHAPAFALAALSILGFTAAACTDAPASPTKTAPFSQTDLRIGTGADAVNAATLTVNYTGWLYDASRTDLKGLQFDSSIGRTPFTFTLGAGQVIKGWDLGVPGMKVGGLRRLVIPPSLAYGEARTGSIPPNATLVFDIELLSRQ